MLSAISMGFSLGPDIDHPNSTITKALGAPVHTALHGLSTAARTVLATKYDRSKFTEAEKRGIDPSHRALTHTLAFTAAMGFGAFLVGHSSLGTAVLAAGCAAVCRKMFRRAERMLVLGAAVALLMFGISADLPPESVMLAATSGWLSHVIADACTTAGVPVMWPIRVKGRYWWRLRLLGGWLRSGDPKECGVALCIALAMNAFLFVLI